MFINNLSYADDMVLMSPSVSGLRKLVSICEKYAQSHDIMYNTLKTECMHFKPPGTQLSINPTIALCGEKLNFVQKFIYLGHVLVPTLSDELDISRQSRSLCARANMLKRNFFACSHDVKILLFQAYCTSLYTSQLWTSYTKTCINKFTVCFNNAFRCGMFVWNHVLSYHELRRKIVYSFYQRVTNTVNSLITHLTGCDLKCLSPLWCHWAHILFI